MDLSWTLESITDSVIMMQRPVGWYNERFEQMSIVEKIPVFGARPTTEYRPLKLAATASAATTAMVNINCSRVMWGMITRLRQVEAISKK